MAAILAATTTLFGGVEVAFSVSVEGAVTVAVVHTAPIKRIRVLVDAVNDVYGDSFLGGEQDVRAAVVPADGDIWSTVSDLGYDLPVFPVWSDHYASVAA
jgi:hypothetical protein